MTTRSGPQNPYSQSVGRDFARMGLSFALYSGSGAGVGLVASAAASVAGGTLVVSWDAIRGGAILGLMLGAVAIAPLWHRPLVAGWAVITIPACVVGAIASLIIDEDGGMCAGVLVMPLAAMLARPHLPFSYPRHLPGKCPRCGYDLRQLRSRQCPECGTDVLAAPPDVT